MQGRVAALIKKEKRRMSETERRKHQRHKLEGACIIQHNKSVGTIVDLSVGGLSCVCLDQGMCNKGLSTTINIFCRKHELCAEDLSMKVLNTEKMQGQFVEELGMRRCRARFNKLEESQKSQLTNIIVSLSMP